MYDENGYLDPSVASNMQQSMINTAIQSPIYTDLNENNIMPSFSIEDISTDPNKNPLPDAAVSMVPLESLDQQISMDGHTNFNLHSSVETTNWDHTLPQNGQNNQQVIEDYTSMQCPNIPFTSTQFAATPDLLNLIHLPRCTPPPGFSTALRPTNYSFDICNEIPGVAVGDTGLMLNTDVSMPFGYNPTPSHLLRDLFHSLPKNGIFSSEDEREAMIGLGGDIFQEMNGVPFENTMLERKRELSRGRGKANFATERQRREQLNEKYKALKSLFPNPTKAS
jgi:Helix-loop-helix DNA-binding domain